MLPRFKEGSNSFAMLRQETNQGQVFVSWQCKRNSLSKYDRSLEHRCSNLCKNFQHWVASASCIIRPRADVSQRLSIIISYPQHAGSRLTIPRRFQKDAFFETNSAYPLGPCAMARSAPMLGSAVTITGLA